MIPDEHPTVSLHNVAETPPAPWTDGGLRLDRAPERVREGVNPDAGHRLIHPTGSELRFVPDDPVEVTLSASGEVTFRVFWGPYQEPEVPVSESYRLGPTPRTFELAVPDRVAGLRPEVADASAFSPRTCRIRFERWERVALHDVRGACHPPEPADLPDRRYVAYGTSITEGAKSSAAHLSYVAQAARRLGVDPLNLGVSGSAYCEPAVGDHLAARDDWDLATLAVSVNMANTEFSVGEFRERATRLVGTVADANPDAPVACVTLYPDHADAVAGDDPDRAADFRAALREAVESASAPNLRPVEGPDLLDATDLSADLLPPGDDGMASVGEGLAGALAPLVG